jgi:hypothetical protein
MGPADPDPGARSNPMAATTRESPASRRTALSSTLVLAGCGFIEIAAWGGAWLSDWQLLPLVGAVAVSTLVAAIIVVMQRRKG